MPSLVHLTQTIYSTSRMSDISPPFFVSQPNNCCFSLSVQQNKYTRVDICNHYIREYKHILVATPQPTHIVWYDLFTKLHFNIHECHVRYFTNHHDIWRSGTFQVVRRALNTSIRYLFKLIFSASLFCVCVWLSEERQSESNTLKSLVSYDNI